MGSIWGHLVVKLVTQKNINFFPHCNYPFTLAGLPSKKFSFNFWYTIQMMGQLAILIFKIFLSFNT